MKKSMFIAVSALIGLFLACVSSLAMAGAANPIQMANEVGFVGCDSAISDAFDHAMKSGERKFSINYFPETQRESIDFHVTFGKPNDTIFQTIHFEKRGGYCYATKRSMISDLGNCSGLLGKDEYFKYDDDAGGALWAKNKGGVTKLFIQSGNSCNLIFLADTKSKASR
jgi:hypothetical protein